MPEFKEREDERERRKMEELAPYLEEAMARKQYMPALADDEIPEYPAYGRMVLETDQDLQDERAQRMRETLKVVKETVEGEAS
jgi:hypothetical protein